MRLLAVPVRVDALWLATDRTVTGPTTDFTRLPYVDQTTRRDVDSGERNLSDAVLPAPFQQDQPMPAGVHLHWSLPDTLTRLTHTAGADVELPRVPDRWLVTRTAPGGAQDRWLVESDALGDVDRGAVTYPLLPADPPGPTGRPWRYLGRTLPLSAWPGAGTDRVAALTALGYGEPTFAAFYPNSSSVFGFHDEDYGAVAPPDGLRYDVVGWYAETTDDELPAVLAAADGRSWPQTVADELDWSVPDNSGNVPVRTVCFGRLTFTGVAKQTPTPGPGTDTESGVWVANTATEALAAHLGAVLPGVTETETEELLEALTVADELESAVLDLPTRLAQARHDASFATVASGALWAVRRRDDPLDGNGTGNGTGSGNGTGTGSAPVTVDQRQARERLSLPASFGALLVALNEAQSAYDAAAAEVTGARRRIFADWHRYLACAYPPPGGRADYPNPDLVGWYLRRQVSALSARLAGLGSWPPVGSGNSLAHRLQAARQAAQRALDVVNAQAVSVARSRFELQQVPAAPYRLPNEPVVLLTGAAATPSDRYGQDGADQPDGRLPCVPMESGLVEADLQGAAGIGRLGDLLAGLATKLAAGQPDHPGLRSWTGQPWHPVLLHWEVEFFPARAGNNLDPSGRDFDPAFVTTNYTLPYGDRELRPRPGKDVLDTGANVYTGSTVLSSAARPVLSTRIMRYLLGTPLARANAARTAAGADPWTADQVNDNPGPLLDWCAAQRDDPRLGTLAAAYRHLAEHEGSNLAQSLGGFNDALVMLRMVRQLPVTDPLGFPGGRALAGLVEQAVAGEGRYAPVPLSDFNPVRAGALRVRRLRIVDSFGTGYDVDVDQPRTTTWLNMPGRPTWVAMPPRLAVPTRVRLDLLDAEAAGQPVSGLPESSPVCGWLLPDPLDDGLRVYAAGGDWLGTLYLTADPAAPAQALWECAPDGPVTDVGLIGNGRLRAVVRRLRGLGAAGLADFMSGLDESLDTVEPEDPGQHRARAVLVGRPVAVVRLALDLESPGLPAIHQDWNVFRQDLNRDGRESNEYPSVRFPVRLGERGRLGDGTLGYWVEQADGSLGDRYHDVVTQSEEDTESPLAVGIDLPALTLTVLLEPAGAVHATTGVLPTVSSRLDPAHHHEALARLETGFLTAPVLTGADTLALVSPAADPDRVWSWRERDGADWVEVAEPPELAEAFPTGLTAREGWLTLRPRPAN